MRKLAECRGGRAEPAGPATARKGGRPGQAPAAGERSSAGGETGPVSGRLPACAAYWVRL
ncbi:hypothetical protein HER39_07875 [Arthrobacter deserti]|uniref:Uncharacterized protein n=1 Tax=Arthrobacter deserti TaxID=1742687 RepID=A0ABX1JMF3_9MICC|nr:hypothetical protein [Arthrobacter deserti]